MFLNSRFPVVYIILACALPHLRCGHHILSPYRILVLAPPLHLVVAPPHFHRAPGEASASISLRPAYHRCVFLPHSCWLQQECCEETQRWYGGLHLDCGGGFTRGAVRIDEAITRWSEGAPTRMQLDVRMWQSCTCITCIFYFTCILYVLSMYYTCIFYVFI